uniref:Uncharacterized protein n=1 Tax=Chromera velia CCMP2878 TaxID=1169474 RepID=A0A0G4IEW8_9ALVE|eukprot:Cvel_13873.t1-p1 / transcript=Cvel_13873.t1 / gene=Cvel_13873 / organism=Chromera_velia_CCMP2878 / gene_product=hypothetical protein / transcript_product=hypothetical protein / location=Cvel_scaffold965:17796-18221(+) / protein_length=142 / sequence_SO=supercontig / SO=protein_coding / is_pseudo=false
MRHNTIGPDQHRPRSFQVGTPLAGGGGEGVEVVRGAAGGAEGGSRLQTGDRRLPTVKEVRLPPTPPHFLILTLQQALSNPFHPLGAFQPRRGGHPRNSPTPLPHLNLITPTKLLRTSSQAQRLQKSTPLCQHREDHPHTTRM